MDVPLALLIEILSLAPARELMYGSDGQALAEPVARRLGPDAAGRELAWLAERGELTGEESREGASLLAENAVRLYALPVTPA